MALPENASAADEAAAKRLAKALNYHLIEGKWPTEPRNETIWFEIKPGAGRQKPGYIILIDSSVYVHASSPEELNRAVDRLISSARDISTQEPLSALHSQPAS